MKRIILSFFFTLLMVNGAHASCQWEYVNQLNKIIKHAGGLLSDYSTCRDNCTALAGDLNSSIANMNKASACGSHILTKTNSDMITFISGRFRLIQKQKMGSTWTKSATTKPVITSVDNTIVADMSPVTEEAQPVFIKPEVFKAPQKNLAPISQPVKVSQQKPVAMPQRQNVNVAKPTRMTISPAAYAALWQNKPRATPRRNVPRIVNNPRAVKKQVYNNNNAKQQQLARRRLMEHRKQALIQQNKIRQVKARKIAIQNHLNKQRLVRQRLLRKRALMRHQNRLRARQLKFARAQRGRR